MTYTPSKELRAELLKRYDAELTEFCLSKLSNEMRLDNGGFVMFERPKYINVTEIQKHKQHLESVLNCWSVKASAFTEFLRKIFRFILGYLTRQQCPKPTKWNSLINALTMS